MSNLKQISKEIKSQDNCSTHEPMFIVYEKIKYPCSSGYSDKFVWVDDEGSEFTDEDLIEHLTKDLMIKKEDLPDLEDEYEEKIIVEGYEYDKWYYQEIPRFKQIFFTRLAAQEYIDNNHYNLSDPYIYVHSLYRNYEMIEIRKTPGEFRMKVEYSLKQAYSFAKRKHKDQLDDNGEDYFYNHLLPVASALSELTKDRDVIAAGILHDVLEDTETTLEELKKTFGDRVANLVYEVTDEGEADSYGKYFPRLKSAEAIMIKLIDRASNISRMDAWDEKRRQHYLKKTKFWKDGEDRK